MVGSRLDWSRTKLIDHASIKETGARGWILDRSDHEGASKRRAGEEIGPAVRLMCVTPFYHQSRSDGTGPTACRLGESGVASLGEECTRRV